MTEQFRATRKADVDAGRPVPASTDQNGYHDYQVQIYRKSASSGLSQLIKGWSTLNEISCVTAFIKTHDILGAMKEYYEQHVDVAETVDCGELVKLLYSLRGIVQNHVAQISMQGPWSVAFFKFCLPPAPDDANAMPRILLSGSAEPMVLLPDAMALNMDESKALELQKDICEDAEPEIDEDEPATKKKKGKAQAGEDSIVCKRHRRPEAERCSAAAGSHEQKWRAWLSHVVLRCDYARVGICQQNEGHRQ